MHNTVTPWWDIWLGNLELEIVTTETGAESALHYQTKECSGTKNVGYVLKQRSEKYYATLWV